MGVGKKKWQQLLKKKKMMMHQRLACTCEFWRMVLKDGQIKNVIDTLGLFDFSAGSEFVGKEIIKCIDLAKDGIHAVFVIFSIRTRFSQEEEVAL